MSSNTKVRDGVPPISHASGGVLGRMGASMAGNAKWVLGVWLIVLIALGAAAPSVFSSLAGAGWQANGSESVQVRELAQAHFGGNSSAAVQVVVHSDDRTIDSPDMQRTSPRSPMSSPGTLASVRSSRRSRECPSAPTGTPEFSSRARTQAPTRWSRPLTISRGVDRPVRKRHRGLSHRRIGTVE
ncbi:hypothetical protein GCM10020255_009080 [Rhodococcus baikonurensis]